MKSPINAPKILLMGAGGAGKTFSLRTLVSAGITPFIIALDGQGLEAISDVPADKLHWHRIEMGAKSFASMATEAIRLGNFTYEGITKANDAFKGKQRRWVETLETLAEFKDDRTGENFGPIDTWSTNRALVIDHFTELNQAAKEWAVGEKLILHEGEWQVAMNTVENLVRMLYTVPKCWVVVIAHLERETDPLLGTSRIFASALGRKLSPKLNPLFSDVLIAKREGKVFTWEATVPEADLKSRNFPIEAKMPPDFSIGVKQWQSRGGIIETAN